MTENKYLTKVCALLQPPAAPRSEKAVKKHRIVHPPKLRKFTAKINKLQNDIVYHHKKGY